METSNTVNRAFLKLGLADVVKSAIMAALTSIVTGLIAILEAFQTGGGWPSTNVLIGVLISGVTTGGVYLLKNLLTNSQDQFLKKEPKKQEGI